MNNYSSFYKRYVILLDFAETMWRTYQVSLRSRFFVYAILSARWSVSSLVAIWFYLMGIAFANLTMLKALDSFMKGLAQGALNLTASDPVPAWAPFTAVVFSDLFGLGMGGAALEILRSLRAQIEQLFLEIHKPIRVGDQPVRVFVRAIRISGIRLSSKTPKLINSIVSFVQQQIEYVTGPIELATLRILFDFAVITLFIIGGSAVTSLLVGIGGWLYWVKGLASMVGTMFILSFFVGTFLFVAFPGIGKKFSASIGYWRVYEPHEQIASQTISTYIKDHFSDKEISFCESITKLRLERRSQSESSLEVSLGLFGAIIALVALALTGNLVTLPFDQETQTLLVMGAIGFLFLIWLWSFLSLQSIQGNTIYVLSSIIEACTIVKQMNFRLEQPGNEQPSSVASQE